jgi:hypothetical protein
LGPPFWTLILDLDLGHSHLGPLFWTLIWDLDLEHHHLWGDMGPQFGTLILGGDMGPPFRTLLWGGDMVPSFWTLIWGVIWDPDLGGDMGPTFKTPILELMPCVISKIKQNSSDMNEIILAPCDAELYWFFMVYDGNYFNCSTLVIFCPVPTA